MVTAITVGFRIPDIILPADHRDIILLRQRLRQHINIIDIRADHTDTCYVIEVVLHIFNRKGKSLTAQFLPNARTAL